MTAREILEAALDAEPGTMCAGCGASDTRWHVAPRGAWLTHDDSRARRCRFPCADSCDHLDCDAIRNKLGNIASPSESRDLGNELDEALDHSRELSVEGK